MRPSIPANMHARLLGSGSCVTVSIALLAFISICSAHIAEHEVVNLPGWSKPLPSKHYSGYIPVGKAGSLKYLHYWLTLSENDPSNDPVILWLNGGPGTSSLYGMLTELGQLVTNDHSMKHPNADGVPSLIYNRYGWPTIANVLFLESPAGVGFSYCEASNCTNTDESTADDSYQFLLSFFQHYPELASNPFHIVGESYAGVYIPMLAQRILNGNNTINFQSIAVGNGCVGKAVGICADTTEKSFRYALEFFRAHFMVSPPMYRELTATCDWALVTPACYALIRRLRDQMGTFNLYNVYDTCGDSSDLSLQGQAAAAGGSSRRATLLDYWRLDPGSKSLRMRHLGAKIDTYVCGGEGAMNAYLSHPKVVEALHVKPGTRGMTYVRTVDDLRPLYAWIMTRIRVAIYSGDVDACVPTNDSEEWIQWLVAEYNVTPIISWKPWRAPTSGGRYIKAGYYQVFDRNNFTFATFNGAGHMVPTFKPAEALTFITRWLSAQDLDQDPPPTPTSAPATRTSHPTAASKPHKRPTKTWQLRQQQDMAHATR